MTTRRRAAIVARQPFATNVGWKEFLEPLQADRAGQVDLGLEHGAAAVVAGIDGHEEVGVSDQRFGAQVDSAATHHHAGAGCLTAFGEPIGVCQQDPLEQLGVVVGGGFWPWFRLTWLAIAEEVVKHPGDVACGGWIDTATAERGGEAGCDRKNE